MDVARQVGEGTAATCYGQQGDGPGRAGLQGLSEAGVTTTPGLLGQACRARRPLPCLGRRGLEASTGVRVRVPGPRSIITIILQPKAIVALAVNSCQ